MDDTPKHDYALSIEDLFKKSDSIGSTAGILAQISDPSAGEEATKALYYAFLGTLKNTFQHPYDNTIVTAESLASKNNFGDASDILLNLLRGYVFNNEKLF